MMQSPSSIQDFPHAPPNQPSKRRFDIGPDLISAHLQQQQQQQEQQQEQGIYDDQPPNKRQKPGMATSFLYKLTELAAYTSAVAAEAYQTITGPPEKQRSSPHHEYPEYYSDVMQIRAAGEEDNEVLDVDNKRNVWDSDNNVDEEEPPPPYDNSWRMPSPSTQNLPSTIDASSPSRVQFNTPQPQSRRRQIRRGSRRPLRRKSSSQDLRDNTTKFDDEDDLFSKFSGKLADMVAEGRAALTSTVDVTEIEMMMAEERERGEKIMRDLGIQTSVSSRRRGTGSSSSDVDYFVASQVDNTSEYSYSSLTSSPASYTSSGFSGLNSSSPASAYSAYSNSYSSSPSKFDRIAGSSLGNRSYASSTGAY